MFVSLCHLLFILLGRATLGKRTCLALRVAQAQMSSASSVPAELNLNAYPVSTFLPLGFSRRGILMIILHAKMFSSGVEKFAPNSHIILINPNAPY